MNPTSQGNPYLTALTHMQQQPGNSTPATGVNPAAMANALGAQAGANQPPVSDPNSGAGQTAGQGAQGAQGGTTKVLLSALQALQQFTQTATDPSEVALVRSIIVLLNQLIQRDQMLQQQQGGGAQAPAQGPQAGAQPGGANSAIAQALAQAQQRGPQGQ